MRNTVSSNANMNSEVPQQHLWSVRMADSVMQQYPVLDTRWNYSAGVVLKGVERVLENTGNERYAAYIKTYIDSLVDPSGKIETYRLEEYNLDYINNGKSLFRLSHTARDDRYYISEPIVVNDYKGIGAFILASVEMEHLS